MKNFSPKTYYTSVSSPIEGLRTLTEKREFATINEEGSLDSNVEMEIGKIVLVNFEDVSDTDRSSCLQKHGTYILLKTVYKHLIFLIISDNAIDRVLKMFDSEKVIALYTSTPSNVGEMKHRVRRESAAPKGGHIFRSEHILLFFTELMYKTADAVVPQAINVQEMNIHNASNNKFTVQLRGASHRVEFDVILESGYYKMQNLKYGEQIFRVIPAVEAPKDFSYYCGNQTFVEITKNDQKATLSWNSLQFQAPFGKKVDDKFIFGDAWHCVGFFSPAILAGLFVVFMLLAITAVGIVWIMDINTMDRFDDPKGKTITINTSE